MFPQSLLMKKLVNKSISYGLSFLFFCAIFHLDYHSTHEHPSGYSICNIGCEDVDHQSSSHQCEKCLSKSKRFVGIDFFDLSFQNNSIPFYIPEDFVYYKLINFYSNSRAPPIIL